MNIIPKVYRFGNILLVFFVVILIDFKLKKTTKMKKEMRLIPIMTLAIGMVILATTNVKAQGYYGGGQGYGGGCYFCNQFDGDFPGNMEDRMKEMSTELGLSDQQMKKFKRVHQDMAEEAKSLRDAYQELADKRDKFRQKHRKVIKEVLTSEQYAKFLETRLENRYMNMKARKYGTQKGRGRQRQK